MASEITIRINDNGSAQVDKDGVTRSYVYISIESNEACFRVTAQSPDYSNPPKPILDAPNFGEAFLLKNLKGKTYTYRGVPFDDMSKEELKAALVHSLDMLPPFASLIQEL